MGFLLSLSDLRQKSQLCSYNSEGICGWEGIGDSTEYSGHSSHSLPTILLVLMQNCHSCPAPFLLCLGWLGFFLVGYLRTFKMKAAGEHL